MIRQVHLAWIDRHLRQIYSVRNDDYFKSLNILLINNFHQLPLINQTALYGNLPTKLLKLTSYKKGAYKAIDQTIVLDQVMQQCSNNIKSFVFKTTFIKIQPKNLF